MAQPRLPAWHIQIDESVPDSQTAAMLYCTSMADDLIGNRTHGYSVASSDNFSAAEAQVVLPWR